MRHSLPVGSRSVIGQVTMTGEPQIALDTADARVIHMPNPLLPKTRSEMALPLITRGQIVGALDVQSNLSGAFTDEDIQALGSLAELVATAIDNARLFEISEQHAREMEFLFSAMTAASGSPNMEESLRNTAEILRGAMDVSDASIFLPDESGLYLVKTASLSEAQTPKAEVESVPMDESVLGWAARYNEAILIGDAAKDPRPLPIGSTTCAVMIVPMRSSGNLTGVLLVESAIPNAFDSNDMKLLQTLSGSLGAIIQSSRLLREVQQANERLLEVDRLKTNFLAAMSHELRTPLNSIIGFSRVILKGIDGPLTETQEQDLTTIYESGKHLLGLVNDILDQAKIEAGKMELSFAYFKLQDVVKGVMSTAVGLTRDKPIRLFTEIEENLPDAYGDEFRTRQILLNLVSNASKFTKEGSVTTSAYITVEDGRQFIQVSVTDTGIGIADKDMGLLFVPFQQIDNSTTRSVEGTGMGLPLAKSLTELQGGRIWVDSEPGVGSTFHVIVPIAPLPAEETVEEPPATIDLSGEIENLLSQSQDFVPESPIILVVEDDEEVINLYRRYLSREGYEVLGTTRPEETEELVLNYHPRVVLLDVNMPTRDGWDVLAHLKDSPSTFHTPVIVCSINPDTERGFHMGAAAYLIKPFTEDELVETIRRIEQEAGHQYILLVDDKPETIRAFRDALETSPRYSVLEATSGQQALDIVQYFNQIDLVILDLRMPGIDGFAVLQSLRSNEKTANIPVLILTAEDINEDERATLESAEVHRKDALDEQELLQRVEARLKDTRKN
jgi:signal transduction histidine kinase/CheY-like chemotaxis protein